MSLNPFKRREPQGWGEPFLRRAENALTKAYDKEHRYSLALSIIAGRGGEVGSIAQAALDGKDPVTFMIQQLEARGAKHPNKTGTTS